MRHHRLRHERRMVQLAVQLPVWPWVEEIRGAGALGLAQLVGECGDIGSYRSPACLWKRMGLAVIGGERQRRVTGDAALLHGYSPRRRSVMFNIGESLIKGNDGRYRDLYLSRKAYEAGRAAGQVCPSPHCRKEMPEGGCTPGHLHNRARRYMEKRFLRDLWTAWRAAARGRGKEAAVA